MLDYDFNSTFLANIETKDAGLTPAELRDFLLPRDLSIHGEVSSNIRYIDLAI
jgi:hypothetical protein